MSILAKSAITPQRIAAANGLNTSTIIVMGLGAIILTLALMALSYRGGRASDNGLSLPLVIHLATVIPALPLGAYVLVRRKGDALHRLLGKIWCALMLATAVSTFWFSLSFIHLFTLLVLVSLPLGIWRARVGDIAGHRRSMEGVYIGLVIAGAFAFIPGRFLGSLLIG